MENWSICPKHRFSIGLYRYGKTQCCSAQHKSKKLTGRGTLDLVQSILFEKLTGDHLLIGDKLCRGCLSSFRKLKDEHSDQVQTWLKQIEDNRRTISTGETEQDPDEEMSGEEAELPAETEQSKDTELPTEELSEMSTFGRQAKQEALLKLKEIAQSSQGGQMSSQEMLSQGSTSSSYSLSQSPKSKAKSAISELNQMLGEASKQTGKQFNPVRFQLSIPFSQAAPRTQRELKNSLRQGTVILAELMNPGGSANLLGAAFSVRDVPEKSFSGAIKGCLGTLIEAFHEAPSPREEIFTLAIAASVKADDGTENPPYLYSNTELQQFFSATEYKVKAARKYAKEVGIGRFVPKDKTPRIRIDMEDVEEFVDFIYSRRYFTLMSWGKTCIKFDTGAKEIVGGIMQTTIASHIVEQYQKFCKDTMNRQSDQDTGEETLEEAKPAKEKRLRKPLSRRTCYRILEKVFQPQKGKALAGLDNIVAAGAHGFHQLGEVVQKLEGTEGIDKNEMRELKKSLEAAKNYLTGAFLEHVAEPDGSQCPYHCVKFALSDPCDERLQELCTHEHNLGCYSCEAMTDHFQQLIMTINECEGLSEEEKDDLKYDVDVAVDSVKRWKDHILRSKQQDKARLNAINSLNETTGLIIYDWAMKIEPRKYREPQKDWFGKRGMSLFGCTLLLRNSETGKVEKYSYLTFLQSCTQDGKASMAVLNYTLQRIRNDFPWLTSVYEKCDNAAAFHNYDFLQYKMRTMESTGIQVLRCDFNDPGAGKDQCDRDFAAVKQQLKIMLNSGHDLEKAEQLKAALEAAPVAIKGMKYAVVELKIDEAAENLKSKAKHKFPFAITKCHSFQFDQSTNVLTAWRYFGIGAGVQCSDLLDTFPYFPSVVPISDFGQVSVMPGLISSQATPKRTEEVAPSAVPCTEPGCSFMFQSEQEQESHGLFEAHSFQLQAETAMDKIRRLFLERALGQTKESSSASFLPDIPVKYPIEQGHALPRKSAFKTHPPKVVQFLKEIFEVGLFSREHRATGESAAQLMRISRDEKTGQKLFSPKDYLTPSQCQNFFSTRFSELKKGTYICASAQTADKIKQSLGFDVVIEEPFRPESSSMESEESYQDISGQVDPDYTLAESAAEAADLRDEISLMNETLAVLPSEWIAYIETDDTWTIGKVKSCDADMGVVFLKPMQRNKLADNQFKWVRRKDSLPVEESKVLSVIEEPARVEKGKQSFQLSLEDSRNVHNLLKKAQNAKIPQSREVEPCLKQLKKWEYDSDDDQYDPLNQGAGTDHMLQTEQICSFCK